MRYGYPVDCHRPTTCSAAARQLSESNRSQKSSRVPCDSAFLISSTLAVKELGCTTAFNSGAPRSAGDADCFGLDQPDLDSTHGIDLSQVVEVFGQRTKFVAVLLGDDDQSSGMARDRVCQTSGQVIVIRAPVLVLDDQL